VPSRWLLRLQGLMRSLGIEDSHIHGGAWLHWQELLDHAVAVRPTAPPAPCPPVAQRPRTIRVTEVELWRRDPYAIYARRILRLKPLDPIDAEPSAADRGIWIHRALERFVRECPVAVPAHALDRLLAIGREEFGAQMNRPAVSAFWWPRFERIARWFVDTERERRGALAALHAEVKGKLQFAGPAGPFTLTATADRIERGASGQLAIIDYKTGSLPKRREMELGFTPQLPLEAAMAAAGGFDGIAGAAVAALQFWRLTGGNPPAQVEDAKGGDPATLAALALEGLKRLVIAFDSPDTVYQSMPDPEFAPRFSDYDHLARVKEWSTGGPDELE
jgi:ATP-dependent helicase/nuclease subunit B